MLKILWLAPNFNHYKARFLNHLAKEPSIELTILSGTGRQGMGDKEIKEDWDFVYYRLSIPKKDFGKTKSVRKFLKKHFNDFNRIMIPAEKKNLPMLLYLLLLRMSHKNIKLFSYNHPIIKSASGKISVLDKMLTKFYYKKLDKVVFYTEASCQWAIQNGMLNAKKAHWANNTVDNLEIQKHYSFILPPENKPKILFIGRLIPSKRVEDVICYYNILKNDISNLTLEIIGDGPESSVVKNAVTNDSNIKWHGTLVEEEDIAPIMRASAVVFVPGLSGLSINHAFAYGRPYITLASNNHGPEISYLKDGVNGYILKSDHETNIQKLKNILLNRPVIEECCKNAKSTSEYLSVENWVQQIKWSLLDEK